MEKVIEKENKYENKTKQKNIEIRFGIGVKYPAGFFFLILFFFCFLVFMNYFCFPVEFFVFILNILVRKGGWIGNGYHQRMRRFMAHELNTTIVSVSLSFLSIAERITQAHLHSFRTIPTMKCRVWHWRLLLRFLPRRFGGRQGSARENPQNLREYSHEYLSASTAARTMTTATAKKKMD